MYGVVTGCCGWLVVSRSQTVTLAVTVWLRETRWLVGVVVRRYIGF